MKKDKINPELISGKYRRRPVIKKTETPGLLKSDIPP